MTVVTWHPEELIDKLRDGQLSAAEQARLDAHVAECTVCRFELVAARDFARELEREGAAERLASLVSKTVLLQASTSAPSPAPASARAASWSGRALLAAGVLVAASAAALVAAHRMEVDRAAEPAPRLEPAPVSQPDGSQPDGSQPDGAPPDGELHPSTEPSAPAVVPDAPAASVRPSSTVEPAEDAASLFARANQARRDGDRVRALALYQRLEARHPSSPEAKLSHAIVGRMLLDSDPEAALSAYDKYGKEGALGEEALVGRADAQQRLGNAEGERAAWQELLARFPGSIHAARAKARLAALPAGK